MTGKKSPVIREKCGEYRGWNAHQQNGEEACPRCAEARNQYMRDYRTRTGFTKAKLYTPAEIAGLQAEAVAAALGTRTRAHLRRSASRRRP